MVLDIPWRDKGDHGLSYDVEFRDRDRDIER